jgi:hypothetical protein
MDSHQPEAAALYASLCFACPTTTPPTLMGPHTGTTPRLQFVLDNKSIAEDDLSWDYNSMTSIFDFLKSNYDILQGIKHQITDLPIAPNISWVREHQDQHKP